MSGSTIGSIVGAGIGFVVSGGNPAGARWGWMIGGAIGGYVDPDVIKGPTLDTNQVQRANEGAPRPLIYGRAAVAGNIIQCGPIVEHKKKERTGKGGGPVQETFTYTRTVAIRIAEAAPLGGEFKLMRAWMNDKLVYDASGTGGALAADTAKFSSVLTFYSGNETQMPSASLEALPAANGGGAGNVPAYRGTCYAVLTDLDCTDFGGAVPQFKWEVSSCGTATACADLYSDALYYFPLDDASAGGVAAELIQGKNGVYSTGVSSGPPLRLGATGSLALTAKTQYMLANYADIFRISGFQNWTVSAWFQPSSLVGGSVLKSAVAVWASGFSGDMNWGFHLRDGGDNMTPTFAATAGGASNALAATAIGVSAAVMAMMTYERINDSTGTFRLYINAALVDEKIGFAPNGGGNYLSVGGGYEYPDSYGFIGNVSDVAIWGRKFSDAEVADSYLSADRYVTPIPDVPGGYLDADGNIYTPCTPIVDPCVITLDEIIADLTERGGVTDYNVTALASDVVLGYPITQPTSAAGAIKSAQQVYFFDYPEWGNSGETTTTLRGVKRGGINAWALDDDDLVDFDDTETRAQAIEFPRKVNLIAASPDANYNPIKQTASRDTERISAIGEATVDTPIVFERDASSQTAEIILRSMWEEANGRADIQVPEEFTRYVTSDCGTYNGKRWRIEKITQEDGVSTWGLVRDRASTWTSSATGSLALTPTRPPSSIRGPTELVLMNLPAGRTKDDKPGLYWASRGLLPGWSGATLQVDRGGSWVEIGVMQSACTMGTLTAALPNASRDFTDATNTLSVDIGAGNTLESATALQVYDGANKAAILYADGTAEIVQFQAATATGDGLYNLATLQRGRGDTTTGTHAIGSRFVLLDDAVRFVELDIADIGATLSMRGVSNGTDPDAAPSQAITITQFQSLREWSVTNLTASRDGSSNMTVKWDGRPRLGTSVQPSQSVHFVGYRLEYTDGVITIKKDVSRTPLVITGGVITMDEVTEHTYPVSEQIADFGSIPATLDVEVFAVNDVAGAGGGVSEPGGAGGAGGTIPLAPENPGFESGLTGWSIGSTPSVASSTWAVITDVAGAATGSNFLRWTGDSTPTAGGVLEGMTYFHDQIVDSPAGDFLSVNVFARCKRLAAGGVGLARARIGVQKYAADGTELGNTISGTVALFGSSLDSGYTKINTFAEKEAGVAYFRIYVEAQGPSGTTIAFDDLSWNGTVYTP